MPTIQFETNYFVQVRKGSSWYDVTEALASMNEVHNQYNTEISRRSKEDVRVVKETIIRETVEFFHD